MTTIHAHSPTPFPGAIAAPEPGLTAESVIQRAVNLRPYLRELQADTEKRGYYSAETHQRFVDAGLTRMLTPKRFGGYEFPLSSYFRAMVEVARGCSSTGWCLTLGAGHVLQAGAMFGEQAQVELFGATGDYIAPMSAVFDPKNTITRVEGGYRLSGTWRFCSGIPHASFFTGTMPHPNPPARLGHPALLLVTVPRGEYEMLDDWGSLIGLKGSGSNGVRVEDVFIPEYRTVTMSLPEDLGPGRPVAPGYSLHGNPLYATPFTPFATAELLSVVVGTAYAMLDEWEESVARRPTASPAGLGDGDGPHGVFHRYQDGDYQRVWGTSAAAIDAAYSILVSTTDLAVERTRRALEEGETFDSEQIQRIYGQQMTAWELVWKAAVDLFRTASTRGAMDGERMQRYWRDLCAFRTNGVHQFDMRAPAAAQAHFGLPITAF